MGEPGRPRGHRRMQGASRQKPFAQGSNGSASAKVFPAAKGFSFGAELENVGSRFLSLLQSALHKPFSGWPTGALTPRFGLGFPSGAWDCATATSGRNFLFSPVSL